MKDNELRAIVLQKYYDLRDRGYFQWCEVELNDQFPIQKWDDLARICDQLGEHGLVDWKPARGEAGKAVGGLGKITAFGVDVIEGTAKSPISISLHDNRQHIQVSASSNVQIGNANSQTFSVQIEHLYKAIENSNASDGAKTEARSALGEFLKHPAITAVLGGLASNLK